MKVLVTGATGFIGSHLVDALVSGNQDVRCLVEQDSNIEHLKRCGVECVFGDVTDKNSLKEALMGVNIIYHLAAVLSYRHLAPETYELVNCQGTKNLLELTAKNPIKKFIYLSSIGAVGSRAEPIFLNEKSPCRPVSPYEISKQRAERIVLEYFKREKLPVVIIRPSRVYGPRDSSELFKLYKLVRKGIFRFVEGMRTKKMSFCYIENLIDACLLLAEQDSCVGQIYFISDEQPYSLEQFVRAIAEEENVKLSNIDVPMWLFRTGMFLFKAIRGKVSESIFLALMRMVMEYQICDITKAKVEVNYKPKFFLKEGMHRTISWYKGKGLLN